jgi:hypothetical protein
MCETNVSKNIIAKGKELNYEYVTKYRRTLRMSQYGAILCSKQDQ